MQANLGDQHHPKLHFQVGLTWLGCEDVASHLLHLQGPISWLIEVEDVIRGEELEHA